MEGNTIRIQASKKEEKEHKERDNYITHERYSSEMDRIVMLPTHIDANKIEATYENGVLTLRVPRKKKLKQNRYQSR
ncbi:Hsp20/alpha crystallin family protein [Dictyobacter kobayashii]|uniref:Hsp20/alpha crystallin family protein n=1 Tax=Dictyobacter kobayashii TaxID=2014872 RepID=UPI000F839914